MVRFSNQKMPLTLFYPDPTPLGFRVIAREESTENRYRIHFTSDGSNEIYFEVGQYTTLTLSEAMDRFRSEVSERLEELHIGETEALLVASSPAYRFTIQWPGRARTIVFLERDNRVYRIIYDPSSLLNRQIMETLQFD